MDEYDVAVTRYKARVANGRLVLDEPTELAEGTVLELSLTDLPQPPSRQESLQIGSKSHALESAVYTIGRDASCNFILDDVKVSRYHALLIRNEQSYLIFDFKSVEGVLLNDKPILTRELEPGDRITIGSTVLVYVRG